MLGAPQRRGFCPRPDDGPVAHGGSLVEAGRLFPGAPEPLLDLSTGINPIAYPVGELAPEAWTRLPEPAAVDAIERAAASAYGAADPAMVVAVPGTQLLISLLPFLLPQPDVAVLGPTYGGHAAAWRAAGSRLVEVTRFEALARTACAVLCNPNNPDGRRVPPRDLVALAARCRLLVVDEAFADFEDGANSAALLPVPGMVVLRSFGKAYGLAGLRLGFALAEPGLARRIRDAMGPWAISGPALAVGQRALSDRAWLQAVAARLARDALRLDALLAPHLPVAGGTRLFRLGEGPQAPALFERLGRAGVYVRRFGAHPHWLRFGLPGAEPDWERLVAALRTPSP